MAATNLLSLESGLVFLTLGILPAVKDDERISWRKSSIRQSQERILSSNVIT